MQYVFLSEISSYLSVVVFLGWSCCSTFPQSSQGNGEPSLSSEGSVLGLDTAVFWSHMVVKLQTQVLLQGGDALLGL